MKLKKQSCDHLLTLYEINIVMIMATIKHQFHIKNGLIYQLWQKMIISNTSISCESDFSNCDLKMWKNI